MKSLLFASALMLAAPLAGAANVMNVQSSFCSGIETISGTSSLALSCTGDFSLIGGALAADNSITISSSGALSLDNLSISAPQLQFSAGTSITLGSLVFLVATNASFTAAAAGQSPTVSIGSGATLTSGLGVPPAPIVAGGGAIVLSPGGSLNIGGTVGPITVSPVPVPAPVPEPTTTTLLLAGLLGVAMVHSCRRSGSEARLGQVEGRANRHSASAAACHPGPDVQGRGQARTGLRPCCPGSGRG